MRLFYYFLALVITSNVVLAQEVRADLTYSPRVELNEEVVDKRTSDSRIYEKIVIEGFDSKVPFYFIQPKNHLGNQFVFLLHGLGGNKNHWIYPLTENSKNFIKLKDSLISLGYSVIIPDAKYHGERSYEVNFAPAPTLVTPGNSEKISNMFVSTVKEVRLIMDYMEMRFEGEPEKFNVIGYSMGGMLAILLNSVENRFESVVACVPPLELPKVFKNIFDWKDMETAEKLDFLSPWNYAEFQKAPITLLMGKTDPYYTEQDARDFFNKIVVKNKSLKFYESGHSLPEDFVKEAIKNLKK